MIRRLLIFLCCWTGVSAVLGQQPGLVKPQHGFYSSAPAEHWEDALLSGNGTMGALVPGRTADEVITLSHAALYLPQQRSGKVYSQRLQLDRIRRLLLSGQYQAAAELPAQLRAEQGFSDQRDPFIPAFNLRILQEQGPVSRYQRSVNFETGEAVTEWTTPAGHFSRQVFVSRADSLVAVRLSGTGKLNLELGFEQLPADPGQESFVQSGVKVLLGEANMNTLLFNAVFRYTYPGGLSGYAGVGKLVQQGGTQQLTAGKLVISGADELLLLVRIRPERTGGAPQSALLQQELETLISSGYAKYSSLLNRHRAIHGQLFSRVKLDLGGSRKEQGLSSEALIRAGDSRVSPALLERVFDAGRYNIISATGLLPPNLQGLWSGTWTAPWASGFTTDGNLPAAISILLTGHTPELMAGFFNYHEGMLKAYRQQAQQLYGCRGIHIPAQLTTRGIETDFGPVWCLTYWTGAAGWTAAGFYDYYQFTGDQVFLREHAYPFMKEAALFYQDFLLQGTDGKLVFVPSYSPENNPANQQAQAAVNATMDVMIARQLLRNCIRSAELLQTDTALVRIWKGLLDKMPVYGINQDGALKEWLWPGLEDNYSHRHASQLYALYDGNDPDFDASADLRRAAGVLIDQKIRFRKAEGGGEMAFGLVQLGLAAAHNGNAAQAEILLNWLASAYWTRGMGSFHNVKSLFNTDISGGLPFLLTQLLCASGPGYIRLLPALPESWKKGSISGLLLRGGITLNSLSWNRQRLRAELVSASDQQVKIIAGSKTRLVTFRAGRPVKIIF